MATTTGPSEAWHYPPELVELVVNAVSLLNKGKAGELDFFRGAGVPSTMLEDLEQQVLWIGVRSASWTSLAEWSRG